MLFEAPTVSAQHDTLDINLEPSASNRTVLSKSLYIQLSSQPR